MSGDSRTPVERFGRLGVAGNRIVAEDGRTAQLRGMSLFWSQWQPQYYDARTVRWLRDDWKIDVVRAPLGVHRDGYLAHPEREMSKIVTVLEAAVDCGIYVIIDWHAHEPEFDAASDFFSWLACNFGRHPNLIYETWNEPDGKYQWSRDIKPYHARVLESIREHDARNVVVAGSPHWCHRVDLAARDPLAFEHVAYGLHFYAGSNKQALRAVTDLALAEGAALMATEWGTCRADAGGRIDEAETRSWWEFLERHQLSYLNWSIADKVETAAALKPGASPAGGWTEEMLSESGRLVRKHLRDRHAARA